MELEVKEHPQAELPQLGHHRWTGGPMELQAHLHPTQPGDRLGQGDGLPRVHAIEGKDQALGRSLVGSLVGGLVRRWVWGHGEGGTGLQATKRLKVFLPSWSTLPSSSDASANSWLGSANLAPSSFTPPPWIWRRASLLLAQMPTAASR